METLAAKTEFHDRYGEGFRLAYASIRQQVTEREERKKATHQRKDFHFLAANLGRFLPEISPDDYEQVYLNVLINHQLSAHSFQYTDFSALDYMTLWGHTAFLEATEVSRPKIFCTYHLGGYRAILGKLLHTGYPLSLVIDNRTYREQKSAIERVAAQIARATGRGTSIDILDAEAADIGRRMAMSIGRGRSVLIFLDGNTGVGGLYNRSGRQVKIPFLQGEIYSRTGIAMLSHALKTPIIPIISCYQEERGVWTPKYWCSEPIEPQRQALPQEAFVREVTRQLYGILETFLRRYPDQWESWFYFHKFLDIDELKRQEGDWKRHRLPPDGPGETAFFNGQTYGLFRLNDDNYLFHKGFYTAYALDNQTFESLHALAERGGVPTRELTQTWGDAWVRDLLGREVIRTTSTTAMK